MKLVKPGYQILAMTGHGEFGLNYSCDPKVLMETAGRTCYKSEKNITHDSADKFVNTIKKNKHLTVTEHSWEARVYYDIRRFGEMPKGNWCKYLYFSEHKPLIARNSRAWEEAIAQCPELDEMAYFNPHESDLRVWAHQYNEPFLMRATVRVICDRGVSHELVRHRPPAFSQESTRFVNYTKRGVEFIEPFWYSESGLITKAIWRVACKVSELSYTLLIKLGWAPQMARSVLLNSLKTELVVSATLQEWQHIINQRVLGTTGTPHPQMAEVMLPVAEAFLKAEPKFFHNSALKEAAQK